jgi:predicted acylesterase/phospholipase RssA
MGINKVIPAKSAKTVSLVLGSGGARGLAHIGVIHWLEENGYKIESISGCSKGRLSAVSMRPENWMILKPGSEL